MKRTRKPWVSVETTNVSTKVKIECLIPDATNLLKTKQEILFFVLNFRSFSLSLKKLKR